MPSAIQSIAFQGKTFRRNRKYSIQALRNCECLGDATMKQEKNSDKLKSALRDNLKKRKQLSRRFKKGDGDQEHSMKLRKRDFSADQ